MTLSGTLDLVLHAFEHAETADFFVQNSPAADLVTLVQPLSLQANISDTETQIIVARHGEKLDEVLVSKEHFLKAEDLGGYFRVAQDDRDLNCERFFGIGDNRPGLGNENSSSNTHQLDVVILTRKIEAMDAVGITS